MSMSESGALASGGALAAAWSGTSGAGHNPGRSLATLLESTRAATAVAAGEDAAAAAAQTAQAAADASACAVVSAEREMAAPAATRARARMRVAARGALPRELPPPLPLARPAPMAPRPIVALNAMGQHVRTVSHLHIVPTEPEPTHDMLLSWRLHDFYEAAEVRAPPRRSLAAGYVCLFLSVRASVSPCFCLSLYPCVCAFVCVCVRISLRLCVCVRSCVCVCPHLSASLRVCACSFEGICCVRNRRALRAGIFVLRAAPHVRVRLDSA